MSQPTDDHRPNPSSTDSGAGQPTIHLDQFLKLCGVATGGQAKQLVQSGQVLVNGQVETRLRRQLRAGDEVTLGEERFVVEGSH